MSNKKLPLAAVSDCLSALKFSLPFLLALTLFPSCAGCNAYPDSEVRKASSRTRLPAEPETRTFYWNYRQSLRISCSLQNGTDFYGAAFVQSNIHIQLPVTILSRTSTNFILDLKWPTNSGLDISKDIILVISTNRPGAVSEKIIVVADTNKPMLEVMKTSPKIVKGGTALAIFRVSDRSPVTVTIRDSDGGLQTAQPFVRDGFWICLFCWPVTAVKWSATVTAADRSGNSVTKNLNIRAENAAYKVSYITVKDNFVAEKKEEVGDSATNVPNNPLEKYNLILQSLAAKKTVSLTELTAKPPSGTVNGFPMSAFLPITDYHVSSEFGEFRIFTYQGKVVRENWHLGLDIFSIAKAKIHTKNPGFTVFSGYNGWSGNTLVIHHGLGLYSVYMHCSMLEFKEGIPVYAGDWLGRTGKTGYALGDHLHFAIMLQGRYVTPWEWMNQAWIQTNIQQVIDDALFLIANEAGA